MICDQAKQHLWDYNDPGTSLERRQELDQHLAGCVGCRDTLNEWTALSQHAFPRKDVKAPAFLWTRILTEIQHRQKGGAGAWWYQWRWMSRFAGAMALLVTIATGAVFYQDQQDTALEALLQGVVTEQQEVQIADASPSLAQVTAWLVQSPGDDVYASGKES